MRMHGPMHPALTPQSRERDPVYKPISPIEVPVIVARGDGGSRCILVKVLPGATREEDQRRAVARARELAYRDVRPYFEAGPVDPIKALESALATARAEAGAYENERLYNGGFADGIAAALAIVKAGL